MDAYKRAATLFAKAKASGLVNPVTDEGAPTEAQIAEAIIDAGDYGAELSEVSTYARRLVRIVRKTDPENAVAKSAVEFLRCIGECRTLR